LQQVEGRLSRGSGEGLKEESAGRVLRDVRVTRSEEWAGAGKQESVWCGKRGKALQIVVFYAPDRWRMAEYRGLIPGKRAPSVL